MTYRRRRTAASATRSASSLPRTREDWHDKRRAVDAVMDDIGGVVIRVGRRDGRRDVVAVRRPGRAQRGRPAVRREHPAPHRPACRHRRPVPRLGQHRPQGRPLEAPAGSGSRHAAARRARDRQRHRRARRQVRDGGRLRQPGVRQADHRQLGRQRAVRLRARLHRATWARRASSTSAAPASPAARRQPTTRWPTASTRSTRWWCSTTSRSRGRTSSSTATRGRRPSSGRRCTATAPFPFVQRILRIADMLIGAALFNVRQTGLERQQAVQEKLAALACYREGINAHLTAAIAEAEPSPGGLLMPNQSLLLHGPRAGVLAAAGDDAHRPRAVRRPDLRHARRRRRSRTRRPGRGWRSSTRSTSAGQAEDRRRLLAFARDLLNSDYAGHRLTFQLFAQSPPFAHLAAVYRNFDFDGPLEIVQASAGPVRHGCCAGSLGMTPPPDPAVQHPRHLSRAEPRQRPLPGRGRRRHRLPARPGRPGSGHPRVGRRRRSSQAQAEQAMDNIELLLRGVPAPQLEDIVKIIVYLTDIRYREAVYRVLGRWLKGVFPVSTGLVVQRAGPARVGGRDRRDRGDPGSAGVTFSLVGRCARTGMLGVVVVVVSPAVAARCAHVRAGVGAAASQNVTDPRLGPRMLDGWPRAARRPTLSRHRSRRAAHRVPAADRGRRRRPHGAATRASRTLGTHGAVAGRRTASAAGNLLASDDVPAAMVEAFGRDPPGAPRRSAGARRWRPGSRPAARRGRCARRAWWSAARVAWPIADLRVDWHDEPDRGAGARCGRCGAPQDGRLRHPRARSGRRARLRRARRVRFTVRRPAVLSLGSSPAWPLPATRGARR